jgi:drug/metabolite transporter (DMT)-like permease
VTRQTRAELALFATTFIWGGTFPIVKVGMHHVSPVFLIGIRFAISAGVVALLFHRRIFPLTSLQTYRGGLLGLFLFLGFVAQNIGLTITTASKSAFITGMMVLFVPLLQVVIERRAPKLGNILGVAIVTGGLWLLTSPEGSGLNAGDALTLLCALVFAIYIVYLDVVSREMSTLQLVFVQTSSVALFSLAAMALFETPLLAVNPTSIGALLYLTFLATLLTTFVQTRYQKDTTPTRAVIIFSIEPVIASVAAYLLLNEHLGALGILGGVLIIGGILLSETSDRFPVLSRPLGPSDS